MVNVFTLSLILMIYACSLCCNNSLFYNSYNDLVNFSLIVILHWFRMYCNLIATSNTCNCLDKH